MESTVSSSTSNGDSFWTDSDVNSGNESRCYKCYTFINGNGCQCVFCEHCSIYYKENDGIHRCRNRRTWCGTCTRLITNKERNCLFCNFSSNIDLCCPGYGGVIDDI